METGRVRHSSVWKTPVGKHRVCVCVCVWLYAYFFAHLKFIRFCTHSGWRGMYFFFFLFFNTLFHSVQLIPL